MPTGGRHGEIVSGIIARLHHAKPPYAVVYSAGVGFRMQGGNIRSPNASVMRRERLPQGKSPDEFIEGASDLAVEVVSPSEDIRDLYQKVLEYFESGAQEVWLFFPERRQVYRYRAPLEVEVLHENDLLTGGHADTQLPSAREQTVRVGTARLLAQSSDTVSRQTMLEHLSAVWKLRYALSGGEEACRS